MTAVLELVISELFEEVKEEYLLHGRLSDSILSALSYVFGQPLLSALDLVDRRAVTHLYSASGKEIFQVCGSSGRTYFCPDSLQFCPCLSFSFGVMKRGELLLCKHILAIHLCKALGVCAEVEKTDSEISTILFQQEYYMETAPLLFFTCLSLLVGVQMTTWPFFLNLALSSLITILLLYYAMLTTTLLPIESLLFQLYDKTGRVESRMSNLDEADTSLDNDAGSAYDDEITRKLREIIGHIIRDFILDWYNTVSDDVQFVQEAFEVFEHIFTDFRTRVSQVDSERLARVLLRHLLRHYRCYKQAMLCATSQSGKDDVRVQQLLVVTYEKLNGHLAMSNLPDTETDHLRSLVAVLLKALLPQDYSLTGTSAYLVRELISRNVLSPFVDMLCRPAWMYSVVVKVLDKDEAVADKAENEEETDTESGSSSKVSFSGEDVFNDGEVAQTSTAGTQDPMLRDYRTAEFKPKEQAPERLFTARYSASHDSESIRLDLPVQTVGDPTDSGDSLTPTPAFSDKEFSYNSNNDRGLTDDSQSLAGSLVSNASMTHFAEPSADEAAVPPAGGSGSGRMNTVARGGFVSPRMGEKPRGSRNSTQEQRIFQHVRIPETIAKDEAFDEGNKYTLYKITYTAPVPQQPQPKSRFNSLFAKAAENPHDEEEAKPLKNYEVCRRFREFLTLQDRLHENNLIRKLIQGVRGPSRMFPMPIGNMDKEYIEKRRLFLQAYLRELCSFSLVCQCAEMKEFLAYDSDPRLAYVRRPADIIPRFDKMIKNAVQEFLGTASLKITDRFATDDDGGFYVPTPPHGGAVKPAQSMPQIAPTPEHRADHLQRSSTQQTLHQPSQQKFGAVAKFKNMVLGRPSTPAVLQECFRDFAPFSGPRSSNDASRRRGWRTPENLLANRNRFGLVESGSGRRTQGDGCDVLDMERNGDARYLGEYRISGQIFRLTREIWDVGLGVNSLSFLATARFVTEFINRELASLTVKDRWMHYLSLLQETLWPRGEWKSDDAADQPSQEQVLDDAARALGSALPDVLPLIVGHSRYEEGVRELLGSFQNQTVNRHLVYHLLDTTVRVLFPDLQNVLVRRRNVAL